MSVLEAPVATVRRERLLLPSVKGTHWCVVELHGEAEGDPSEEIAWKIETFAVTGWYASASRAGRRRAELERENRWLTAACRAWLRQLPVGFVYGLAMLEWEEGEG